MIDLSRRNLKGRDLSNLNLSGADLSNSDLSFANLEGANLEGANFTGATLCKTNLSNVRAAYAIFKSARLQYCIAIISDMDESDFSNAVLSHSLLNGTSFIKSNFTGTACYRSSFVGCNFGRANMTLAKMCGTNLTAANFTEAVLKDTDFELSDLYDATFYHNLSMEYRFGKILDKPITGYKKVNKDASVKINAEIKRFTFPALVTLEIPKGSIVFSINGNKCRTNKAKVVDIEYMVDTDEYLHNVIPENEEEYVMVSEINEKPARSIHDHNFLYVKGQEIEVNNFDLQYNVECGSGIHFFLTKEEAINFRY